MPSLDAVSPLVVALFGGGAVLLVVALSSLAILAGRQRRRDLRDVVLEISERALGDDLTTVGRACEALRGQGFRLAVDGVGTGYASFLALDAVRPDVLKADPALVRGVHENLIRQELLASIVAYGARIGAHVVAVGVENEDEVAALRAAGAELGQGFLFAGPAPLGTWIAAGLAGH